MSKRKAKQPNFFQYFLNEFIFFRRDFLFETKLSPKQVSENFRQMNFKVPGFWEQRQIVSDVTTTANSISFEVKGDQRNSLNVYRQSAKATGTIFVDDDMTIVKGTVMMGSCFMWFWMALSIAMFFGFVSIVSSFGRFANNTAVDCLILMVGAPIVYLWFQMYIDRNRLFRIIEHAVLY